MKKTKQMRSNKTKKEDTLTLDISQRTVMAIGCCGLLGMFFFLEKDVNKKTKTNLQYTPHEDCVRKVIWTIILNLPESSEDFPVDEEDDEIIE